MPDTRTVPDPVTTRPRRRPGWCPPWCRVKHDGPLLRGEPWCPEDDRRHWSEPLEDGAQWGRDGRSRRGYQRVQLRRIDRPGRRGTPEVELQLTGRWRVRDPDRFDLNGCDVGLTAAEARALGLALLDAAELLERPGWNPSWKDAFRSVGEGGTRQRR